jgi:hypothetical protein
VPDPEGFVRLFFSGPEETRKKGLEFFERISARSADRDRMMLTDNSRLLAQHLPNARLSIYPDSGHGFLDQYPEQFAQDVRAFLNGD